MVGNVWQRAVVAELLELVDDFGFCYQKAVFKLPKNITDYFS